MPVRPVRQRARRGQHGTARAAGHAPPSYAAETYRSPVSGRVVDLVSRLLFLEDNAGQIVICDASTFERSPPRRGARKTTDASGAGVRGVDWGPHPY
ncbi:MAG: hypothetical protein EBS48_05165 [Actinobacteria bacterium]|nr:hypothetical protein [Actinomycetota bacterium]